MNTGNRARLKNGQVVTVIGKTPGNLLCKTAEGDMRYVTQDQICHILGQPCENCEPTKQEKED